MNMQDLIANMLTIIRNAQKNKATSAKLPLSKLNYNICRLLCDEGYISAVGVPSGHFFTIDLKYYANRPVIEHIQRVSKPSKRIYVASADLPLSLRGLGVYIISTSKGIVTDRTARTQRLGGEIICEIY